MKKGHILINILHCWGIYLVLLMPSHSQATPPELTSSLCQEKEAFIETRHEISVNGRLLPYRAVAGTLIVKNDQSVPIASLFYISYTKEGVEDDSERPVTFCFNGGPGSSSVWLHLGLLGPKRVSLNEQGEALPPYRLVENEWSLLDVTDLVFIDPVSTGFSRAIPPDTAKQFHGVEKDIHSIAAFIRLYLTRFNRWESPKFIAGESYGTTRAASLADYLHDHDYLYVNGIVLISSLLNFQSIDFSVGNDLPYLLFLPSYTATAWYHHRLDADLQANFSATMQAARDFVIQDYALALFKGDLLTSEQRTSIVQKLARFTGLSPMYIEQSRLRIDSMRFIKELLRNQGKTVGRFDSRFKGMDANAVGEYAEYDPSGSALFGAFAATFNHYIRNDLQWTQEGSYEILTCLQPWDYGCTNQYLNVSGALRSVMTKNPNLRVFVANGYYDLATPFFATEYTFHHLGLDSSLTDHVSMKHYDAGHFMYIHRPSLIQLKQDLTNFYRLTLQKTDSLSPEKIGTL